MEGKFRLDFHEEIWYFKSNIWKRGILKKDKKMKISDDKPTQDLINYVKQTSDQQKVTPLDVQTTKNQQLTEERVEISKKASDLNKISDIIQKTPDVREEKVAFLKEKIASGSYSVSVQEIADKMLREFLL